MPRKREVIKREIIPDPKFKDPMIARFINGLMRRGKKTTAAAILYNALDIISRKQQEDPLKVFHKAMDNVRPLIEVKSRRGRRGHVSGAGGSAAKSTHIFSYPLADQLCRRAAARRA